MLSALGNFHYHSYFLMCACAFLFLFPFPRAWQSRIYNMSNERPWFTDEIKLLDSGEIPNEDKDEETIALALLTSSKLDPA